jgi:uncharacterized protein (DUF1499 family)
MNRTFLLLAALALTLSHCSGSKSERLGAIEGKLSPCPDSPNCVSSQSLDKSHYVDPLYYKGMLYEARAKLLRVLSSMDRVKIITVESDYIHVEFISAFFHFVDDVEFCFDEEKRTINVRSASRIGYYDLGVNRRRVERIRNSFLEPTTGQNRKTNTKSFLLGSAKMNRTGDEPSV